MVFLRDFEFRFFSYSVDDVDSLGFFSSFIRMVGSAELFYAAILTDNERFVGWVDDVYDGTVVGFGGRVVFRVDEFLFVIGVRFEDIVVGRYSVVCYFR